MRQHHTAKFGGYFRVLKRMETCSFCWQTWPGHCLSTFCPLLFVEESYLACTVNHGECRSHILKTDLAGFEDLVRIRWLKKSWFDIWHILIALFGQLTSIHIGWQVLVFHPPESLSIIRCWRTSYVILHWYCFVADLATLRIVWGDLLVSNKQNSVSTMDECWKDPDDSNFFRRVGRIGKV